MILLEVLTFSLTLGQECQPFNCDAPTFAAWDRI